jgi:23S rRNA (uracil1939-C5)-methyltransferase
VTRRSHPDLALEGRVRDVAHGGDAVIETERGIVLARGALPGERVRVQVEARRGGVQRGRLIELLEPSGERVQAPCDAADRCGGCPLMTLAPAAQARLKRAHLTRALAHVRAEVAIEWVASPRPLGYRVRARLAWQPGRGGGAKIGYRAAGTDAVEDIERCAVLAPELARGLSAIRTRLGGVIAGEGVIALGLGAQARCVTELQAEAPQPPAVYEACRELVSSGELGGIALRAGGRELAPALFGDPRQLGTGSDGRALWAPPGAFMQANAEVNALLAARVLELAAPEGASVLELFAGHGNFSVALAARAAAFRAVESDRLAADACRQNLNERGLTQASVLCDDAARGAQGRSRVDVVVLDPPRTGARAVLPAILARRPKRIVYVSCDAATLRRDLGELCAGGYRVDAAAAFDMFPHTAHLETVVRLAGQPRSGNP